MPIWRVQGCDIVAGIAATYDELFVGVAATLTAEHYRHRDDVPGFFPFPEEIVDELSRFMSNDLRDA